MWGRLVTWLHRATVGRLVAAGIRDIEQAREGGEPDRARAII